LSHDFFYFDTQIASSWRGDEVSSVSWRLSVNITIGYSLPFMLPNNWSQSIFFRYACLLMSVLFQVHHSQYRVVSRRSLSISFHL
jgi:hypothetical protein